MCAENTADHQWAGIESWNYLRVRGEYLFSAATCKSAAELPPCARRIHLNHINQNSIPGTTSVCAENTLNELGLL